MTTVHPRSRAGPWVKILAIGAMGAVLYFAHAAFIPVTLALLLSLALSGPVEALHRRGVSRSIGAALILVAVLALMAGVVASLWAPAQAAYANAPETIATVKKRLRPVVSTLRRIDDLRDTASTIASSSTPQPPVPAQPAEPVAESAPKLIVGVGIPAVAAAASFVFVTLFLLTGGPPMLARMTAAFVFDTLLRSSRRREGGR
ncbi:MAG TPA: hypothetical protein VFX89_02635 [Gammaproteobacteria bacterium]|nr:hypothetical protein [Gammaproteobacteria bacterium]